MSEKIIKDQEETKEETKIGSEEIVKNGETKTGSEEIVKNEEKEVPEKVDANSSFWSKVKHFLKYSIQTWIARCFLIAFGLELLREIWCLRQSYFCIIPPLYSLLYCLRCS